MYVSTLSVETKNIVKIADCFQLFILSELLFAASVHIYQFLLWTSFNILLAENILHFHMYFITILVLKLNINYI